MGAEQQFDLSDEDELVIETAKKLARRMLCDPSITPHEIVGLGHALYTLERLPETTPGAYVVFGISIRGGDEIYGEMSYITFHVYEDEIALHRGGSVYDRSVGSDSYSLPGWSVGLLQRRRIEIEVFDLEPTIHDYLNCDPEMTVEDESTIAHI